MIVRIQRVPFGFRSDRLLRLQGASVIALGVAALTLWNPLTRLGPNMCLLRRTVGLPCPLCGMTRGVALCLRGHFHEASQFNPLAAPLLLLAMLLAVKWAIEFAGGRRLEVATPRWLTRGCLYAVYLILIVNWIYLLIYRREDPFPTTWLGQLWTILMGGT